MGKLRYCQGKRIVDVHPESDMFISAPLGAASPAPQRTRVMARHDGGQRHSPASCRRPGLADVSAGGSAAPPPSDAGFTRFSERQTKESNNKAAG